VAYDSTSDAFESVVREDPRIKELDLFVDPRIHTVFGDICIFLLVCEK